MNKVLSVYLMACMFICGIITAHAEQKTMNPQTPAPPTAETIEIGKITLQEMEGCEYSTDGVNWQKSPVFTGLLDGETYTFYQRYAENSLYAAGEKSVGRKMQLHFLGDLNCDGFVNMQDSTLLARWLTKWNVTLADEAAADLDNNGIVDDWDSILLDRYLAGRDIDLALRFESETLVFYENTKNAQNDNPSGYFQTEAPIPLQDLTCRGYTFEGWYNGTDRITAIPANYSKDLTLTARWSTNEYTITYENTKGLSHENPVSYTVESGTISLLPLTEKDQDGYTFDGWYREGIKVTTIPADSIGAVTLTAKWIPTVYTITYENTRNADNPNPTTYTIEDVIPLKGLEIPGYYSVDWYNGTEKISALSGCTGNLTLTPQWEIKNYTITYENTKGASHQLPETYTILSETIYLENLQKEGYLFNGWLLSDVTTSSIPSGSYGDITLTALWTPITYTITYSDGGTHSNPANYTVESGTITLKDARRTGYRFLGWYEDGTKVTTISCDRMENIVLTAQWTVATTVITFDYNGGTGNQEDIVVAYGDQIPILTGDIPEKLGYVFEGYYYGGKKYYDSSLESYDGYYASGDWALSWWYGESEKVTFTAKWSMADWSEASTLTCETNNQTATEYHFQALPKGQHLLQVDLTKTYCSSGTYAGADHVMMLTLKDQSGTTIYAKTFYGSAEIVLDLVPGEIYYISAKSGWYDTGYTSLGKVNSSYDYEARYRILSSGGINLPLFDEPHSSHDLFEISYSNTKGADNPNIEASCNFNLLSYNYPLMNISQKGYLFEGWYLNGKKVTSLRWRDFNSQNRVELIAKMTPIDYQAIFQVNGETVGTCTFNMDDTSIANSPEPPQKEHYTVEWVYTLKPEDMIISNYKYTPINYTITYDGLNGGTHSNITTYNIETGVTLTDPDRTHYTFNGWYWNGERVTEIPVGTTGDITLTAAWTPKVYTVTFVSNYGAAPSPITYTIDRLPTLPNLPSYTNDSNTYYFYSWYNESTAISKITEENAGDLTLVAYWAPAVIYKSPSYSVSGQGGYVINTSCTGTIKWNDTAKCYDVSVGISAHLGSNGYMYGDLYMNSKHIGSYSLNGPLSGYVTVSDSAAGTLSAKDYLVH